MQRKDEYLMQMRHTLDRFGREVSEWQDQLERSALKGKLMLKQEASHLSHRRDDLLEQLRSLESATSDGWEATRDELDAAWAELQSTWKDLVHVAKKDETVGAGGS